MAPAVRPAGWIVDVHDGGGFDVARPVALEKSPHRLAWQDAPPHAGETMGLVPPAAALLCLMLMGQPLAGDPAPDTAWTSEQDGAATTDERPKAERIRAFYQQAWRYRLSLAIPGAFLTRGTNSDVLGPSGEPLDLDTLEQDGELTNSHAVFSRVRKGWTLWTGSSLAFCSALGLTCCCSIPVLAAQPVVLLAFLGRVAPEEQIVGVTVAWTLLWTSPAAALVLAAGVGAAVALALRRWVYPPFSAAESAELVLQHNEELCRKLGLNPGELDSTYFPRLAEVDG